MVVPVGLSILRSKVPLRPLWAEPRAWARLLLGYAKVNGPGGRTDWPAQRYLYTASVPCTMSANGLLRCAGFPLRWADVEMVVFLTLRCALGRSSIGVGPQGATTHRERTALIGMEIRSSSRVRSSMLAVR